MNTALRILGLAACAGFLHCAPDRVAGGAGAGNPPLAEVAISLQASSPTPLAKLAGPVVRNPDGTFTVADSLGNKIVLSSIRLQVEKIEFSLPDTADCGDASPYPCLDHEINLNGSFLMDLISGESTPAIGVLRLPPGLYEKVGMDPAGKETAFQGPNLFIVGKALGVPERPFSMELRLSEGLDFRDSVGIRIKSDSLNRVNLSMNVEDWFKGIDMRACLDTMAVDTTGVARLGESGPCGGIGARLKDNVGESEGLELEEHHKE